jgi:hypothetical protein
MNLKSHRTKYWIISGAVLLLAGIVVFCFLHFPPGPMALGDADPSELPGIHAAIRKLRVHNLKQAFRTGKLQRVPSLSAEFLARPIVGSTGPVMDFMAVRRPVNIMVVTKGKDKDSHGTCYWLERRRTGWEVIGEISPGPSVLSPSAARESNSQ